MTTIKVTLCLSSFSPSLPPSSPILLNSPPSSLPSPSLSPPLPQFLISRRSTVLFLSLLPQFQPSPLPASAFELGISGPKDWLKEQKKKSFKYLLAPIVASRDILTYALHLLLSKDTNLKQKEMEELQGMLISAGRDCVAEDRNSLVAFQARTGVEVCTFKLLVSNASSLLNDNDPAKLEAEARLDDLIRSFTLLNGFVKGADIQHAAERQKVADALTNTLSSLHEFEQGIKGCIEV